MRFNVVLATLLLCIGTYAHAQTVAFCDKGTICWADGSNGQAKTELWFRANGGDVKTLVNAGIVTLPFVSTIQKILPSDWLCVQARHVYPDGKVSSWYVSDTEGVCKKTVDVLPGLPPPPPQPPPPPPVTPPPPPVPPTGDPFKNIRKDKWTDPRTGKSYDALRFEYTMTDCPKNTTRHIEGSSTKTLTIVCMK